MKRALRTLATGMFLLSLMVPAVSLAQVTETQSGFCQVLGWLVRPIGLCEPVVVPVVVTPADPAVVTEAVVEKPAPAIQVAPTIIEYSTTTQPIYNEVTNEYVTVQQTGVSESLLNKRVSELLVYIASLGKNTQGAVTAASLPSLEVLDQYATKEYVLKSVDKVYDNQSSNNRNETTTSLSSSLTDVVLAGTTNITGNLGVGTSTPQDILSVAGAVYLEDTTPAVTTNRLYNSSGDLYWNGILLSGLAATTSATSSVWLESGSDAYRLTGNVGVGTSTPEAKLSVYSASVQDALRIRSNDGNTVVIDQYGTLSVGDMMEVGYDNNVADRAYSSRFGTYVTSGRNSASAYDITLDPSGAGNTLIASGNVGIGIEVPSAKLDVRSASTPLNITRNVSFGGGTYWGGQRLILNQANNAVAGIATYYKANNSAGTEVYAGMFGGGLTSVTSGAERGQLVFTAAYQGLDPGTYKHLIINATAASAADVLIPSGRLGVGTTTPSEALTVAGNISATAVKAEILDIGGEVCNVEAYGAVGNNLTLNDAAIARAIAACGDGGTVYFPMGQFRISQPIVLDKPVTLRGAYSPRWSYSSAPRSSIRADFASFSGVAMVHVRDRVISGQANHNNGGRLEYISLDGGSAGSNVNGVYFEGLVRDWKLTDVDISQTTGNGFESAVGTGSGNPRGFTIRGLSIYSSDGHGFRATALNDSYIEDLLVVGNALRGIYMSSIGETKINNSRAVFNALEGLYIDGASSNGGMMFTDFSTDRNDRHGVRISLTGTTTVTFNGLLTRRDGANLGGGSETPYAGVAVIGSPAEKVAPVFINGLTQIVGVDDSGNPPLAPQVGVRVTNAKYVKIEGQLWGVNKAYEDGGGNERFIIEEDSIIKEGTAGVNTNPVPLYNNKWVASTTAKSLLYDGAINIGSSTEDRLLNIVAASGAGARFKDTTNNVTFDMRAEDSQAFFGTFSNHQLRFQTNNVSRMTIDTNGRVGIGTTTPVTDLSVVGDAVFTGALRDSTNSAGLNGFVLQTTGTGSRWVATSSLGFASGAASTFLSLTDTPSFFNAGRLPFTNTAGNALTDSSSLTFNGDTMQITSSVDQPALRLNAASVSTNSVLALSGPLSTTVNNGKVFQVGVAAEAFGRGQFFTDGSYGIGSGAATRDTFFSRVATSTLLVSSDRTTSGLATLSVSGKIAVGTTTPDQALDVIGTIQSSVLLGGSVGLSTDANGNIIRTPSDERLKTNIQTIENPLDTLLALRGVQYEWLDKDRFGTEAEIGFIAQEVDMQLPEVVRKGGDYWSLNTANIVAVVVEAMKEMWVTITGNQERIELLEARVSALESAQGGRQAQPAPEPVVEPEPQTDPVSPQPESEPVATTTESTVEPEEVELSATEPTEPVLPPENTEQPTTATST